jgi:hypothetical protein
MKATPEQVEFLLYWTSVGVTALVTIVLAGVAWG